MCGEMEEVMAIISLMVYEFISATGSWSTHSGFGAFIFFFLFFAVVIWGFVLAFMAPSWYTWSISKIVKIFCGDAISKIFLNVFDIIDLCMTGFYVGPFVIAPLFVLLYFFFDFGNFAQGGWLMSSYRDMNWFDWIALIYIAFSNYSFFDRFNIKSKNENIKLKYNQD